MDLKPLVSDPTMPLSGQETLEKEEARVRAAYTRRSAAIPHDRYSCFNLGNLLIAQERERYILAALRKHGCTALAQVKFLEVGCGNGFWVRQFIQWGVRPENIVGIDLLPERVEEAKKLCPSAVALRCRNAVELDCADGSFDIAMQSTLFSSILDPLTRSRIASEMIRVLRPGGLVLWYDFHINNPKNPDVKGIEKREVKQLFHGCHVHLEQLTLVPPLARAVAPISPALFALLSKIKFLRTHYLGTIVKARSADDEKSEDAPLRADCGR